MAASRRAACCGPWNKLLTNTLLGALGILLSVSTGCDPEPATDATDQAKSSGLIAVSYPLQVFTKQLVGDSVPVGFPCAGPDPQRWQPRREDIRQMQAADLVVTNGRGATYAQWMVTVSLPASRICETATRGLELSDYIAVEDLQIVHSHGPEGEHSHPTMVARTWLDPALAIQQSEYLAGELERIYPERKTEIASNLGPLRRQLEPLVERLPLTDQATPIWTASSEMKFLTRATGLTDWHFNWTAETKTEQIENDLIERHQNGDQQAADSTQPAWLLVPDHWPQLNQIAGSEKLKQLGVQVLPIDLLDDPRELDLFLRMSKNLDRLQAVCQ